MKSNSGDVIAEWQKLVRQFEGKINAMSGDFAARSDFSRVMNDATQLSLFMQAAFGENMEQVLAAMRLPTDTQISEIVQRLDRLEEKIDKLSQGRRISRRAEPPRTKRPAVAP